MYEYSVDYFYSLIAYLINSTSVAIRNPITTHLKSNLLHLVQWAEKNSEAIEFLTTSVTNFKK